MYRIAGFFVCFFTFFTFFRLVFLCLAALTIRKVFELGRLLLYFYVFGSFDLGTFDLNVFLMSCLILLGFNQLRLVLLAFYDVYLEFSLYC
jgi:hypothetical protein